MSIISKLYFSFYILFRIQTKDYLDKRKELRVNASNYMSEPTVNLDVLL